MSTIRFIGYYLVFDSIAFFCFLLDSLLLELSVASNPTNLGLILNPYKSSLICFRYICLFVCVIYSCCYSSLCLVLNIKVLYSSIVKMAFLDFSWIFCVSFLSNTSNCWNSLNNANYHVHIKHVNFLSVYVCLHVSRGLVIVLFVAYWKK